jgi:hypothetical protein
MIETSDYQALENGTPPWLDPKLDVERSNTSHVSQPLQVFYVQEFSAFRAT